jgi:hypothetical protein
MWNALNVRLFLPYVVLKLATSIFILAFKSSKFVSSHCHLTFSSARRYLLYYDVCCLLRMSGSMEDDSVFRLLNDIGQVARSHQHEDSSYYTNLENHRSYPNSQYHASDQHTRHRRDYEPVTYKRLDDGGSYEQQRRFHQVFGKVFH